MKRLAWVFLFGLIFSGVSANSEFLFQAPPDAQGLYYSWQDMGYHVTHWSLPPDADHENWRFQIQVRIGRRQFVGVGKNFDEAVLGVAQHMAYAWTQQR